MHQFSFYASLIHLEKQTHANQSKPEKAARVAGRRSQEKKYTKDEKFTKY